MTRDQPQPATTDRTHVAGRQLPTITDALMRERLSQFRSYTIQTKPYTLGLLRQTASDAPDDAAASVVWEHMRRMIALMEEGTLGMMLAGTPAGDPDWGGLGVFDAAPAEVRAILETDPLVQAGLCTLEIHPAVGFPGTPAAT
jgi:hypothetical protein